MSASSVGMRSRNMGLAAVVRVPAVSMLSLRSDGDAVERAAEFAGFLLGVELGCLGGARHRS